MDTVALRGVVRHGQDEEGNFDYNIDAVEMVIEHLEKIDARD